MNHRAWSEVCDNRVTNGDPKDHSGVCPIGGNFQVPGAVNENKKSPYLRFAVRPGQMGDSTATDFELINRAKINLSTPAANVGADIAEMIDVAHLAVQAMALPGHGRFRDYDHVSR
jgi:hypothetical protein